MIVQEGRNSKKAISRHAAAALVGGIFYQPGEVRPVVVRKRELIRRYFFRGLCMDIWSQTVSCNRERHSTTLPATIVRGCVPFNTSFHEHLLSHAPNRLTLRKGEFELRKTGIHPPISECFQRATFRWSDCIMRLKGASNFTAFDRSPLNIFYSRKRYTKAA